MARRIRMAARRRQGLRRIPAGQKAGSPLADAVNPRTLSSPFASFPVNSWVNASGPRYFCPIYPC